MRLPRLLVKLVIPENFLEISLCLFERWDGVVTFYMPGTCIIRREAASLTSPSKLFQQKFEMTDTRMNISAPG